VIRTIHRWLLVMLYHLAMWLRHRATTWQKSLRHALLSYAVRHYHPTWPETAKPVKHWEERLAEAQQAGKPISPIKHRQPLPDDCHCPNCGATLDTTMDMQEMSISTKSCARYVAFRLHQNGLRRSPPSSAPTVDAPLPKSKNARTLTYTNARISVVLTGTRHT